MRSTKLACGCLALVSLFSASNAFAGKPVEAHTFAVSAERMFGITHTSFKLEIPAASQTSSYTTLTFLSRVAGVSDAPTIYSSPRLAGDFFVIDGLSIGAALGFVSYSTSTEAGGMGSQDGPSGSGVLFAPRVGYAYMFTPLFGIWPRAGITYLGAGTDPPNGGGGTGTHLWAFTAEVPFVIAPVPHVGFHIGPTLDLGLGGGQSRTAGGVETTIDATATEFGIQAGMFVYF
jgi:hypothetical protein